MEIVSREAWGARSPTSVTLVDPDRRTEFIVHYSAGPTSQTIRQIQDFHMDVRGWSDIGYNFLCRAGVLYLGRGWDRLGTHTVGHNTSGIAVCFVGRDGDATAADKAAIRWLYEEAVRRFGVLRRYGHRDLDATTCPGDDLYAWTHAGMPEDEMSVTDVRVGLHGLLDEAANRSTSTGRQVADDIAALLAAALAPLRAEVVARSETDAERDRLVMAAIDALRTGGTSVDTTAVLDALRVEGESIRSHHAATVTTLRTELAEARAEIERLRTSLARAARAESDELSADAPVP